MYVVHVVSCSFIIKWWLEIFIHFFPHCPPLASCRFIGQSVHVFVCLGCVILALECTMDPSSHVFFCDMCFWCFTPDIPPSPTPPPIRGEEMG